MKKKYTHIIHTLLLIIKIHKYTNQYDLLCSVLPGCAGWATQQENDKLSQTLLHKCHDAHISFHSHFINVS